MINTDININAAEQRLNVLQPFWTRSRHARLGRRSHPNYPNYISFWIAQQDFRVSRLSFSPPLSHWLWSGGTDVRSRGVAMEMGTTVAFREDEAEHRRWLRIRQVKDSRRSQNHQRTRMTNKFRMKCLQATSVSHAGCQWYQRVCCDNTTLYFYTIPKLKW